MREARYETPGKRIPLLSGYKSADVRGEEDCVTSPKSVCVGGSMCVQKRLALVLPRSTGWKL